jgi:lipopolysaccharide biosynthesis protein
LQWIGGGQSTPDPHRADRRRSIANRAPEVGVLSQLRRAKSLASQYARVGISGVQYGLACLHLRRHYIKKTWHGPVPLTNASRVALVVHFDRRGRFLRYFQHFVSALHSAGFAVIVISNSPKIDETTLSELVPSCAAVIHRKNIGLDFGAWRDGLTLLSELSSLEALVLANDSVFGPVTNIAAILQKCDFDEADIWGMTDSYDGRFHLQSYFLVLGRAALTNPYFSEFWRRVRYLQHKPTVIRFYEVGFTQKLLAGGLRARALFPYPQIARAIVDRAMKADPNEHELLTAYRDLLLVHINGGSPLNPTHFFWDYLITDAGFPFIKRELLEKNPMAIPFMVKWRGTLQESTDYPIELIDEYLQLNLRNRIW